MLQDLRAMQRWTLSIRVALTWVGLGAVYLLQIPEDWPGEPFLFFLLVVIGTTLCFGARLISAAISAFLFLYFFEPVGSPTTIEAHAWAHRVMATNDSD